MKRDIDIVLDKIDPDVLFHMSGLQYRDIAENIASLHICASLLHRYFTWVDAYAYFYSRQSIRYMITNDLRYARAVNLPCVRESWKVQNHFQSQLSLLVGVFQGRVQGMPKDVFHFVTVHHTHPFAPHIRTCSLQHNAYSVG